jgi:hypothetical protein
VRRFVADSPEADVVVVEVVTKVVLAVEVGIEGVGLVEPPGRGRGRERHVGSSGHRFGGWIARRAPRRRFGTDSVDGGAAVDTGACGVPGPSPDASTIRGPR